MQFVNAKLTLVYAYVDTKYRENFCSYETDCESFTMSTVKHKSLTGKNSDEFDERIAIHQSFTCQSFLLMYLLWNQQ